MEWIEILAQLSLWISSNQSIFLMGTLTYKEVSSVISIIAIPVMDSDGKINLNIQSVRLGMVPVRALITKLAQKAFDDNRSSFEDDPKTEKNVQAIIRNESFDPIFSFPDRWVRITDFSIEEGALKLTLLSEEV